MFKVVLVVSVCLHELYLGKYGRWESGSGSISSKAAKQQAARSTQQLLSGSFRVHSRCNYDPTNQQGRGRTTALGDVPPSSTALALYRPTRTRSIPSNQQPAPSTKHQYHVHLQAPPSPNRRLACLFYLFPMALVVLPETQLFACRACLYIILIHL